MLTFCIGIQRVEHRRYIYLTRHLHYHQNLTRFSQGLNVRANLEVESTLTDRYQTTVPETVRRALRLGKRDKILYTIRAGGEVVLARVDGSAADDPVLAQFLDFLASDIATNPQRLQVIDSSFVQRLQSLGLCTEVDLDAPLSPDDE